MITLKKTILWVLIPLFTFTTIQLSAQSNQVGENNLQVVSQKIDESFDGKDRIPGFPKYKHFARWKHWWSSRVNPDGSFTNVTRNNRKELDSWLKTEASSRASEANWDFIGPDISTYANNATFCRGNGYGRVDRITFHPTDPDKFYVATPSGGAWFTDDGGTTWSCITDNLPIIGCAGIAIDPSNTNTLYILTGTADNTINSFVTKFGYRDPSIGIMKSVDHGENWETVLSFDTIVTGDVIPFRLKIHPLDSDMLVAATDQGLFVSRDKGDSWVQELTDARVIAIEAAGSSSPLTFTGLAIGTSLVPSTSIMIARLAVPSTE